ncbi:hypothetical protein [Micrococcus yunnanensis]|uniref:ATP-grasp domain-containing protein n=1 Tax=Micrococcus yunnanensis TaxID=566027 RepID=A0ABR6D3E3_9MICC|nr:hypothetical protein [Micrococcus yunnanensis]MBA9060634.1 hypothetical protein [Micrococcus yunnanensis]TFE80624.1 hypothetical protein E2F93_08850 [Micrococcus yunnanensis]
MMRKKDIRSYSAHGLWFVEAGDTVLSISDIDQTFVRHVFDSKGIERREIAFERMPAGVGEGRTFDGNALVADSQLVASLRQKVHGGLITTAEALWMTPETAELIGMLGLEGSSTLAAGGGMRSAGYEVFNSKYAFRVFAAGIDVPIPEGVAVFTREAAERATLGLLSKPEVHGVMCKRAHGGGGGANHLIYTDSWARQSDPRSSGASKQTHVKKSMHVSVADQVSKFWEAQWEWMSNGQTFPVVVEHALNAERTLYVETCVTDDAVFSPVVGELVYKAGALVGELCPAPSVSDLIGQRLKKQAHRVFDLYHKMGYRGVFSVDFVVLSDAGKVYITEVNARYTGSTHLYRVMPHLVEKFAGDSVVYQFEVNGKAGNNTLEVFLERVSDNNLCLGTQADRAAVAVTPPLGSSLDGPVMAAAIAPSEAEVYEIAAILQNEVDE